MKKSLLLLIGLALFCSANVMSQTNPTSVYSKNHIKNRKPIPYSNIRESDVMWSKLVWRIVDLREKMNLPMYYPTTPQDDRYSLIDLLMYGIENEGLTAYSTNDDEFKEPMTLDEIHTKFDAQADTMMQRNRLTGELEPVIIPGEMHTDDVKRYMVKEQWFFDKQTSTMQVRIIGICPIREYVKDGDTAMDGVQMKQLFWVYFPEARPLLATHEVFNPFNDAARYSFDDLFMKRRFSSFITQISNVHNNRGISEYTVGINSMLEAEKIKNDIFEYEHDLWEY
ncbi:gliding motility protein GldN [Marinifilum caeruleilacunae]|uniref:Gliding motility protein GldN n=1 Tax=Marinifilum caeruleilacunae TaxID=2499076 RepID=A0ABX1WYL7_9BACT|nr:gliding motility protein GldN [Marinifilum caeruleilacunae]NOU61233.1 gliding motility protein GldN [Marinifilum caeruleilacunae]